MKKKSMYLVRKNHINEEPVSVTVYYDEKDGSVDLLYDSEEDCYFNEDKFLELFDTKEEAVSFQYTFKKLLISKMSHVKDYLQMMEDFIEDDNSSEFYHKTSDYLGFNPSESVVAWMDKYRAEHEKCSKYKKLAENGVVSLHDQSVLYSEVESVYSEDKKIILRLKGLTGEVSVTDKIDKEFVSEIFGLQY